MFRLSEISLILINEIQTIFGLNRDDARQLLANTLADEFVKGTIYEMVEVNLSKLTEGE